MSAIGSGSVDMILTDLPYGITACAWDSLLPLDQLWRQFDRVVKPDGAVVLTACQPFTTRLIQSNLKHFKYCWYWHKNIATGFCFAKFQPMRCMEDVAVFYRKMPTYHPQGLVELDEPVISRAKSDRKSGVYKAGHFSKEHMTRFTNYPKNLLEIKSERGFHPTQKPVALFEYLIKTYTDPGALVLDACTGSGTTAIACIRSGRNYIGFEIDEAYHRAALVRIQEELKQHDVHDELRQDRP